MRKGIIVAALVSIVSLYAVAPITLVGPVAINEVAWSGSREDPAHEWIELVNTSDAPVTLDGWRLVSSDGAPDIQLEGVVAPRSPGDPDSGHFLLERETDEAVPARLADMVYTGALTDEGEILYLYDDTERLMDTANACCGDDPEQPWPAGADAYGIPPFASMERIDPTIPDGPSNWATYLPSGAVGEGLAGTPGEENRAFNLPPVAAMSIAPPHARPGQAVAFSAAPSFDLNDPITAYSWDFGDDGIAAGQTASHTYAAAGLYTVVLTVEDAKGARSEIRGTVDVNTTARPLADFSVRPAGPPPMRAGDLLLFQDESSDVDGTIESWAWDFGDGTTADTGFVRHAYEQTGSYTVSLHVTDDRGGSAVQTRSLTLAGRRPIASFEVVPPTPTRGVPAAFDAAGSQDPDGVVVAYRWDFDGDGTIDLETSQQTASYTYAQWGDHPTELQVVDADGDTSAPFRIIVEINDPPVAQFSLSAFDASEMEAIDFSDCSRDADGELVEWQWDFGDGATSAQAAPTHPYEHAGTYTVTLTVTDDAGTSAQTSATITVLDLPPLAALAVESASLPTGAPFAFDASGSSDPTPGGSIANFSWDFDGDGVADVETVDPSASYAYPENGTYRITVRVTDAAGSEAVSDPITITVLNRPPSVRTVSTSIAAPLDGMTIDFTAEAADPDGSIATWQWTFGDGTSSTSETPSHAYARNGTYEVVLVVIDDDGEASDPAALSVAVGNAPPIASFTVSPSAPSAGTLVRFNAQDSMDPSPQGTIAHVAWDFGDGTTCPSVPGACGGTDTWSPLHRYTDPGTYAVTLIVIDDQGAADTTMRKITVVE